MSYQKGTGQTRYKNIASRRFGRLVALEYVGKTKYNCAIWKCQCDCGNTPTVQWRNLRDGQTKSCGCLHREVMRNMMQKRKGVASFNQLFSSYKLSSKSRGIEFGLSGDEFKELTKRNCFYCGQKPSYIYGQAKNNGLYTYNGIDRVDPSRGYTTDNCVTACGICNLAKQGLTGKQFIELVSKIYNLQKEIRREGK